MQQPSGGQLLIVFFMDLLHFANVFLVLRSPVRGTINKHNPTSAEYGEINSSLDLFSMLWPIHFNI